MAGHPIQLTKSNTREANRGDVDAVAAIDAQCFEYPWARSDFQDALKSQGATVTLVVEHVGKPVAFMVYNRAPRKTSAQIMRIAVLPEYRRRTIGRQLIGWLRRELDQQTKLRICVQESDSATHLWLRAVGFYYDRTLPSFFLFGDDVHADAYEFVFGQPPLRRAPRGPLTVSLKNRCSKHFGGSKDEADDCES